MFEALFKGVSTRYVLRAIEKLVEIYAPQTKILEGRTNISECVFEALFNVL